MLKELRENIVTLIEAEAEQCPTVFSMYAAENEKVIDEVYQIALKLPERSIQAAIYEMEKRYGD